MWATILNHPVFMTFEATGYEEYSYPYALGWTLDDGRYKSVLIKPEDTWLEWNPSDSERDRQDLFDLGESALDVIKELDLDSDSGIIYVEDVDAANLWLSQLFNAYSREIPFEIEPLFQLFPTLSREDFDEERRFLIESNNFSQVSAEDQVIILQSMWANFGGK